MGGARPDFARATFPPPPATQLLLTEKEEKRVAREGRTGEGREEGRTLPGNRRRAAPAKEGRGAVWATKVGVPRRGGGYRPSHRKAAEQRVPRVRRGLCVWVAHGDPAPALAPPGGLAPASLAPPPPAAALQARSRLAKVR